MHKQRLLDVQTRQRTIGTAMTIRSTAVAAALGALFVAPAFYLSLEPASKNPAPAPPKTERAAADLATEAWPICTSMGSVGESPGWAQIDPDLAAGKKALAANDWNDAIAALASAALRDTRNADVQNYLGYAYRRLRQLDMAFKHYQQALTLNPRHRSAHEHLGEAYLVLRNLAKAEEHLAALEQICLIPCEEYGDLRKAIATYRGPEKQVSTGPTL